jgi:hypothetical protein
MSAQDQRAADIARLLTSDDCADIERALRNRGESAARRLEDRLLAKRRREARPRFEAPEQLALVIKREVKP